MERRIIIKSVGEIHEERQDLMISHARSLLWIVRGMTTLLLWSFVIRLLTMGEVWGPRLLKTWPSGFTPPNMSDQVELSHVHPKVYYPPKTDQVELSHVHPKVYYPPKRVYKNNGYLMVSCNGGLNQMRGAICDMVAIARYLNVTLIVPELDKSSFWADSSDFKDIFDVKHFFTSLRSEVRILKEMPPWLKRRVDHGMLYSLTPVSWSDISYYRHQVTDVSQNGRVQYWICCRSFSNSKCLRPPVKLCFYVFSSKILCPRFLLCFALSS